MGNFEDGLKIELPRNFGGYSYKYFCSHSFVNRALCVSLVLNCHLESRAQCYLSLCNQVILSFI